jgi:hypothetical protein
VLSIFRHNILFVLKCFPENIISHVHITPHTLLQVRNIFLQYVVLGKVIKELFITKVRFVSRGGTL